ncbi:MAG TPA: NADH-quinone oxidoreductase subunit NuoF [Gemmataceae bacterium]|nr:NADH-quinone oxidoreductase subunit NuoF [Gemmataceae bacterium]
MDLAELHEITETERARRKPTRIRCCTAAGCVSSGSPAVKDAFDREIAVQGLSDKLEACSVGCLRLCCAGPLVQVDPTQELFEEVKPAQVPAIVASLARSVSEESTATRRVSEAPVKRGDPNRPFFTKQMPIVLENSGIVEPERIESYIAAGGYQALYHALHEMTPAQVVDTVTRSGLRGRGGAGYPTGVKWGMVAKMPGERKFLVCNADEGDPGAFMDRSVLESDPHRVLEGMAIAAYAVGATQGYIYVRGEYPLAIHRLELAIKQARKHGLLGTGVFDSAMNLRIDLRIGAGAFVCGEETALIESIEGKRGMPQVRPPYPAERGLWDCPTLINNVETYANIAPIVNKGADWFASIGTAKSKGTKVFALAGKIHYTGLVEVPMGMPLRTIVEELGGGAPNGGTIKAVQTGGPSGGCIPANLLDTPVDYESLQALGSIMGSGGMIVMDQTTNMVEVAKYFMEFCMDESCGKCIPCRAGTVQMYRLLSRIAAGDASQAEVKQLELLCDMVKHTSLCGLGQSAPNPVLSTLRYFRQEYDHSLKNGRMALPLRLA